MLNETENFPNKRSQCYIYSGVFLHSGRYAVIQKPSSQIQLLRKLCESI